MARDFVDGMNNSSLSRERLLTSLKNSGSIPAVSTLEKDVLAVNRRLVRIGERCIRWYMGPLNKTK